MTRGSLVVVGSGIKSLGPAEIAAVLSGEPGRIRVSLTAPPVALGAVTEAGMAATWTPAAAPARPPETAP